MNPLTDVRRLVDRYFSAIDRRDWDALGACFDDDAVFEAGWDAGTGRAADVRRGRADILDFVRQVEAFPSSLHAAASVHVEEGDAGLRAVTFATAYLVDQRGPAPMVRVRGLRYTDELLVTGIDCTIVRRRHEPLWELDAPAAPLAAVPATT